MKISKEDINCFDLQIAQSSWKIPGNLQKTNTKTIHGINKSSAKASGYEISIPKPIKFLYNSNKQAKIKIKNITPLITTQQKYSCENENIYRIPM